MSGCHNRAHAGQVHDHLGEFWNGWLGGKLHGGMIVASLHIRLEGGVEWMLKEIARY